MPTILPSRANQTSGGVSWLGRGVLAASSVLLVAFCALLAVNGPQLRAAAEAQEAQIVEAENKAVCSKLGIGLNTSRYAEYAAGLAEIRARYLQRSLADSIL